MKNIKLEWWTILVLILWIIFLQNCNKPKPCPSITPAGTTVEHHTIYDTIPFYKDTVFHVHATVTKPSRTVSDTVRNLTYNENWSYFEDSLLRGNIYTEVDGTLLNATIFYSPKFPKYIKITDSVKVTQTFRDTINMSKNQFLIGGRVGTNLNTFNVAAGIGLKTKKDRVYLIDYDFANKSYHFSIFTPIKF